MAATCRRKAGDGLIFADSSPAAGREFTDDGQVHEDRGLKGRDRQARARTRAARARRPTRNVPIPPELVVLLRQHLEQFGAGPGGRLFRSENGNPIQPSTYWQVWQKVRALALTPQQRRTLMRRPYDLRHSGVTWRLNSGVPATEVAAWAGHSVEVLMRVYARCGGLEDVWVARMDATLRPDTEPRGSRNARGSIGGGFWRRAAQRGSRWRSGSDDRRRITLGQVAFSLLPATRKGRADQPLTLAIYTPG